MEPMVPPKVGELAGRVGARAQTRVEGYLRDLTRLVNLDSGTFDAPLVNQVGCELAVMLERGGWRVERHPATGFGDHLVATLPGDGRRRVMLLGHFDTVYPAGTAATRPLAVREGRVYGPGVLDMKGGLVLGIHAVELLASFPDLARPDLVFVLNSDEEVGSPTSRQLIEEAARAADAVYVLEPGREPGGVLATRKGVGMYSVTVHGRAAHAGAAPQDGRSAVLELAYKTVHWHQLNDFEKGTTVNVTVVRGGTRRNVVPELASAEIDVRVPSHDEATRVDQAIREIAARSWVPDTRAEVSGGLNRPPMQKLAGAHSLSRLAEAIVETMGLEFAELASGGGSDGNFTASIGVPTLDGLGPIGRGAHSSEEYIDLESLPTRLTLLALLIALAPPRSE
uniref:M20 family peptidase n=1 Tax=Thermorudis peleae TaxID=1382356 RepID=A0A831X278_9BACT